MLFATGLDISLLHQFTSFLVPCATHFLCLRHYLALGTHLLNYRPGFTSHALGRAIKRLHLRDCDVVCCQLECLLAADKLTMQKAVFLLQQSGVVKEVQVLYRVCCVPTTTGGPTGELNIEVDAVVIVSRSRIVQFILRISLLSLMVYFLHVVFV